MQNLYLNFLDSDKKKTYKDSSYIDKICNIEDRWLLPQLRIGCSKLNGHMYLRMDEANTPHLILITLLLFKNL